MLNPLEPRSSMNARTRARIGALVPISNTNLESDMILLRPKNVSLHFARVGGYDLDAIPDSEQMRKFGATPLESTIDDLAAARPDVILYGCTSATLAHGPAFDTRLAEAISKRSGAPAVTAAGAIVEALRHLKVRRVAFSTPYVQTLGQEAASFLEACGFTTVSSVHGGEGLDSYQQGALTPEEIFDMTCRADSDMAEALVIPGTDVRGVEVIDSLEHRLGKPVVTSNQAMMFCAVKRLGLDVSCLPAIGRLLSGAEMGAPTP